MNADARQWLKLIYAPGMLLGFNAAAVAISVTNAGHGWLIALLMLAILVSFLVEKLIPYQAGWNESQGDALRDVIHAIVNESLNFASVLLIPVLTKLLHWQFLWPRHWPVWGQWLLAVIVADCGITLMHWASHRHPLLWRFHAVHHAVTRFYGFNGLVKHPIHLALETAAGTLPLLLLGMSSEIGMLLAFAVALQLLLQHSNVDMRLGPLRKVLALAPSHRFHHQKWAGVGDVNFGLFTTLWDRLLGTTVFDPHRRFVPGEFGIGTQPDYPQSYLKQLVAPFSKH